MTHTYNRTYMHKHIHMALQIYIDLSITGYECGCHISQCRLNNYIQKMEQPF